MIQVMLAALLVVHEVHEEEVDSGPTPCYSEPMSSVTQNSADVKVVSMTKEGSKQAGCEDGEGGPPQCDEQPPARQA